MHSQRTGLTILEIVVALVLLVGAGAMFTSSIGFIERSGARHAQRLAAHEAAHRLILQYIEDESSVRNGIQRVDLQDGTFAFDYELEEVVLVASGEGKRDARHYADIPIQDLLTNRLKRVTIHIYPLGMRGVGRPLASVTRVYDIVSGNIEELLERLMRQTAEDRANQ